MSWTEAESTPLLINTWIVVGLVASLIFLWLIGDSARLFTFATFCSAVAVIGL